MAWVSDPSKDPPHNKNWVALTLDSFGDFKAVAKNEELLPMLPLNFTDKERKTRYFLLAKYETTQDQYDAVMKENCAPPSTQGRLPAVNVSWYDAVGR